MMKLGSAARRLREKLGLTQREAATALGVSNVHLCNIENDKSEPSPELLDRFRELWGIDLYVLSWCEDSDLSRLPKSMRAVAAELSDLWAEEIELSVKRCAKKAAQEK